VWVRLEKPTFDLVGVVLASLGLTAVCVGVALLLGAAWGGYLILHGRARPRYEPSISLHLEAR